MSKSLAKSYEELMKNLFFQMNVHILSASVISVPHWVLWIGMDWYGMVELECQECDALLTAWTA